MNIRPEEAGDVEAIREVNRRAFGGDGEARLADALRDGGYVQVPSWPRRTARRFSLPTWMPGSAKLFVTCAAPKSTVVVVDTSSRKQVAAIAVGHTATGVAVSPDGRRLYVCNRFDNDVSVIDSAAGKEIARVPGLCATTSRGPCYRSFLGWQSGPSTCVQSETPPREAPATRMSAPQGQR